MLRLRLVRREDEDFLREIRNKNRQFFFNKRIVGKKRHHDWFAKELQKNDSFIYIIEEKCKAIGTISLTNITDIDAELSRFVVWECYRGCGYGKATLDKFKRLAKDFDLEKIYLYTGTNNSDAQFFYARNGFWLENYYGKKVRMEYEFIRTKQLRRDITSDCQVG